MSEIKVEHRRPIGISQSLRTHEWERLYQLYRQFNSADGVQPLGENEFMSMIINPNMFVGTEFYEGNQYWDSLVATATNQEGTIVGFMQHSYNTSGSTRRGRVVKRALSTLNHLHVPFAPDKVYRTIITRGVANCAVGEEVDVDEQRVYGSIVHSIAKREAIFPDRNMTIFEYSGPDFATDRAMIEAAGFEPFTDNPSPTEGEPPVLLGYRAPARAVLIATVG